MNSFELMGEAELLAAEGQRQFARSVARAIGRAFGRRSAPKAK
jgi:hypothetical protein